MTTRSAPAESFIERAGSNLPLALTSAVTAGACSGEISISNSPPCARYDGAPAISDDVQSLGAGTQRQRRFVQAYVDRKRFHFTIGHIRRITDHQVKLVFARQRRKQIAFEKADPIGDCMPGRVVFRNNQRRGADVDRRDPGRGQIHRSRNGNAPRPRSHVEDARVQNRLGGGDQLQDERFGFRAWNQYVGSDAKVEREEFAVPDQISHRFRLRPPLDKVSHHGPLVVCQQLVVLHVKLYSRTTAGMSQQDLGFQPRRLAAVFS